MEADDEGAGGQTARLADDVHELKQRLDELTDLFRRRLLDDREKGRAIAALQSELEYSRDAVRRQVLEPVLRQLIFVLDRLDKHQVVDDSTDGFVQSVQDELLEVLAQYGISRVKQLDHFDPELAEVVGRKHAETGERVGTIAAVERPAYLWSGALLRPAAVILWERVET